MNKLAANSITDMLKEHPLCATKEQMPKAKLLNKAVVETRDETIKRFYRQVLRGFGHLPPE